MLGYNTPLGGVHGLQHDSSAPHLAMLQNELSMQAGAYQVCGRVPRPHHLKRPAPPHGRRAQQRSPSLLHLRESDQHRSRPLFFF